MAPKIEKPLGYWLKHVDNLLTRGINKVHSSLGLSRTGWQVLDTISQTDRITIDELEMTLGPFIDREAALELASSMHGDGLLDDHDGLYYLTEKGKNLHSHCLANQQKFREKAMQGLTEDDYQQVLETLRQIAQNLS